MQQSETREKQRLERLQQALVQTLQTSVATNVEAQVNREMRNTLLPGKYAEIFGQTQTHVRMHHME